jgi:tetratricopeptide (TPR) repeat protein
VDRYRQAAALLEEIGEQRAAARVSGRLAEALRFDGRADESLEVLQQAYAALADGPRDADLAFVAAEYARIAFFVDRYDLALEPIELALDLAEALKLPQVLAEALNTKGVLLFRRATESEALIRQSVRVALSHDLPPAALRAQFNLAGLFMEHDRYRDATGLLYEAIELARRRGYRPWESQLVTQLADTLSSLGDWDEAKSVVAQVESSGMREALTAAGVLLVEARLAHGRGAYERLEQLVGELKHLRASGDRQDQGTHYLAEAVLKRSQGRFAEAIELAQKAASLSRSLHQLHYATEGFVESVGAAMDAGDFDTAERLVAEMEGLDPVDRRPLLDAQVSRLRARLSGVGATGGSDEAFVAAIEGFRAITARYWLAVSLCEYGESLVSQDRRAEAEPLLAESAVLFAELRAQPWLDRLAAMDVGIEIAS